MSTFARTVGVFLNGRAIPTPDHRGEPIVDESFYLLFNAHFEPIEFTLPAGPWGDRWHEVLDTSDPIPDLRDQEVRRAGQGLQVPAHSVVVLRSAD